MKSATTVEGVFDDVADMIKALKGSIQDEQSDADARNVTEVAQCQETITTLLGIEKEALDTYNDAQAHTQFLEDELATTNDHIDFITSRIERNANKLADLKEQRCAENELFVDDLMSHKEAIALVDWLKEDLKSYFATLREGGEITFAQKAQIRNAVEMLQVYTSKKFWFVVPAAVAAGAGVVTAGVGAATAGATAAAGSAIVKTGTTMAVNAGKQYVKDTAKDYVQEEAKNWWDSWWIQLKQLVGDEILYDESYDATTTTEQVDNTRAELDAANDSDVTGQRPELSGDIEADLDTLLADLKQHMEDSIADLEAREIEAAHDFALWRAEIQKENIANEAELARKNQYKTKLEADLPVAQDYEAARKGDWETAKAARVAMQEECRHKAEYYASETARRGEEIAACDECIEIFDEDLAGTTEYTEERAEHGTEYEKEARRIEEYSLDREDFEEAGGYEA